MTLDCSQFQLFIVCHDSIISHADTVYKLFGYTEHKRVAAGGDFGVVAQCRVWLLSSTRKTLGYKTADRVAERELAA